MTDMQIVKSLKENQLSNNEKALKVLYERCYFMCEQMVLKNNGTKEDAKDVFQDAVVVFYDKVKKDNFELTSKMSTYLFAVSRNLWLKQLRSKKKFVEVEDDYMLNIEGGIVVPDKEPQSELSTVLADLLEKSGEKCLTLLKMFYFEKMKMKEIAESFGFSNEQVAKNQKVRCIKKLRVLMGDTEKYREALGL